MPETKTSTDSPEGRQPPISFLPDAEWDRFQGELARAVERVCPRWLKDQQEDLVQSALIRVIEIVQRGDGERDVASAYLWRVAHNAVVDEIRRRGRWQQVSIEDQVGPAAPLSTLPSPEQHYAGQQIHRAVRACLGHLVPSRKVAVTLYTLGHRASQIADRMDWSHKRAKNLIYRGLADMRRCLTKKGFQSDSYHEKRQ